jgi:hypothetical protein
MKGWNNSGPLVHMVHGLATWLSGRCCGGSTLGRGRRAAVSSGTPLGVPNKSWIPVLLGAGILAFLRPLPALAQASSSTLLGIVTDPSGLAIPDVAVTARQEQTAYVRRSQTNAAGEYVMPFLPVGAYTLTADKAGFSLYERTGIQVTVGTQIRADIRLVVGSVKQTVQVTEQAAMVNTTSSQVGGLVDSARIVELPLSGRDVVALTALLPGVSDVYAPQSTTNACASITMDVNGGRQNMFAEYLDAALMQEQVFGKGLLFPPPDAIQEFRMLLNDYAPEYGRNNGASLSAVTKTGTNQLHGTAYEFVRNDAFNARSFFAPNVTPSRQNQFGASAGYYIPLPHGKRLYLFGNYEGLRIRTASTETSAFLPTAAERSGAFNHLITDPTTGQPFPNNSIPTARLNPVALNILAKLPVPTSPNGNLVTFGASPEDVNDVFARGDYDITPKHRLMVSVWEWRDTQTFALSRSTDVPGWSPGSRENYNTNVNLGLTSTLSPSLLNEAHVGAIPNNDPFNNNSRFDLHSLGANFPAVGAPPWIIVAGDFSLEPNVVGFDDQRNTWFTDTLSWIKGRNTIKTGFQLWKERTRFICNWLVPSQSLFDGSFSGDPIADFLLGIPTTFTTLEPVTLYDAKSTVLGSFVQDDIKVSRRLTLNMGLRWDLQTPWASPEKVFGTFLPPHKSTVFPAAPPYFVYPGDAGIPSGLTPTRYDHFSPRVGFAWDPFGNGRSAVRGGFGVFSGTLIVDSGTVVDSPPFQVYSQLTNPPGGLSNPLEGEPSIFPSSTSFVLPISTFFKDWNQTQPYTMEFNFTVQRQFSANWTAQVGYVGSQARHLYNQIEANPGIPGPGATLNNIQQRRPYNPWYAGMVRGTTDANSSYNSLQLMGEHRMAHGFTVLGSYTWSKSIDSDSGISEGDGVTDPFNPQFDHGISDFNREHVFSLSFVSYLPQLHAPSSALLKFINGWELTGIASYKTGLPINVVTGQDTQMVGAAYENFGQTRPELVGDPYLPHTNKNQYLNEWFNTAAFALPCPVALVAGSCPVPALGNFGRNVLTGPGYEDWDLGFFKNTGITERVNTQFRFEAFDTFNRADFGNPLSNMSGAQFGAITSADPGRTLQLSIKFIF